MKFKTENKNVTLDYSIDENEITLELLQVDVEARGQGLADKTLEKFIAWAQSNSKELGVDCISLACYPQDETTDKTRLAELYLNNGFEWDEGDIMIRPL